ncbi:bifunctional tetrahydrofolate synthase/dihydrofolate synthase [Luteimonas sp. MC1750]|uniref:bifunctional tetrahydrofolate synthase/dihydrofolate synthase n=1 Tax=Luteimonas sp. MC1750 TaxID=2799326 RepID=UPI0018F0A404|nr:bifunctional tetrahydrofolate synthase/dihydrofolate synthase [Luteimonas sp. MC1750]MBJ6983044.1 bifunctional tetrahydrofolate synthase/dihydrofolate synthase [Luteimonas sp. MC1750]QQO05242.1 bifunctional tetrahydrofolate synthase/dihydrofolate synthase [Luteimonas sp. MC1750]
MADPRSLQDWLRDIEGRHPREVDLGLERVREVALRMGLGRPARLVATVAGSNGKGSTVAFIEAIAAASGLRVGAYTSPHLLAYNERVRIDGADAGDAALVEAFEAVEGARGATSLTYFEVGTLAALWLFERADLDLAVLEVGLGGRLDAVNLVDPDVAVITTVDLDHQDWLGHDREAIGAEKAGIARAWTPLVLGEDDPPSSVLGHAYAIGASAIRAGSDYRFGRDEGGESWWWREPGFELALPLPGLAAPAQLRNAAAAIAALRALDVEIDEGAWARGVAAAQVPGRLQRFERRGVEVLVDVGHNPQAARALSDWLRAAPPLRTVAVYGALADKDACGVVDALAGQVDGWHLAGTTAAGARGRDAQSLAAGLGTTAAADATRHDDVDAALEAALADAGAGGRVLAFGSFHVAAAALAWLAVAGSEAGAGGAV